MDDIARNLRAAAAVLLDCPEHVQIDGQNVLVNLHKRADEMKAAADEIERLRQERNHRMATASAFDDHLATMRVMLMEHPTIRFGR